MEIKPICAYMASVCVAYIDTSKNAAQIACKDVYNRNF